MTYDAQVVVMSKTSNGFVAILRKEKEKEIAQMEREFVSKSIKNEITREHGMKYW